jgi:hypothetical protein
VERETHVKANDEVTKEHIEFLEAQLLELEVEVKLLKEDRDSWKAMAMVMQSDRDCRVA